MQLTNLDLHTSNGKTIFNLVAVALTLGYTNVRIHEVVYVVPPRDGIQEFNFDFDPPCGPYRIPTVDLFPLTAKFSTPEWFRGVRVTYPVFLGQHPVTLRSVGQEDKPIGSDWVAINGGAVSGDKLTLSVSYTGGCVNDHALQLDWNGMLLKSNPPKAKLRLSHNGFDDPCEAIISEHAIFDLSTVPGLITSGVNELIIEGSNAIVVPIPPTPPHSPSVDEIGYKDWNAFDNRMPPGRNFYVSGQVIVPSGGYTVSLEKTVPQGINPSILMLDLTVTPPTGPSTEPILSLPVRYDETTYDGQYTLVQIMHQGKIVQTLDIKTVW